MLYGIVDFSIEYYDGILLLKMYINKDEEWKDGHQGVKHGVFIK